jgi:hypothetical protein
MLKMTVASAIRPLIMGLMLLCLSCGKQTQENKTKQIDPMTPGISSELESLLEKQEVSCEAGRVCPNYITKIVVIDRGQPKFCTGFLVNSDTVATSSSCLSSLLRLNNQDCSKDVHFFFTRTFNRGTERVGCKKVLTASQLSTRDPILWREDVAFLELETPLYYRRYLPISRDGFQNRRSFTVWGVEQMDEFTSIIRREECEAVHETYINPLASHESSPNMTFAGCVFKNGYSGAPILDSRGRVRGLTSTGMDPKLRSYLESTGLLTSPLRPMFHSTSFACAPTIYDSEILDEKECGKDMNYTMVDNMRADMLSPGVLYQEMALTFEKSLSRLSRYIEFGVRLHASGDLQHAEIYPKCFKPVQSWRGDFRKPRSSHVSNIRLPQKSFRRSMDVFGRIQGLEQTGAEVAMNVQFNPRSMINLGQSTVWMWNESTPVRDFPNLTACE